MGYVSYPLTKIVKLTPASLSPLLKLELDGEIELKLVGEAFATYREYLVEMRQSCHGMACFEIGDQAAANRNLFWVAFARFDGKIEGLMMYRLVGEEVTKLNFQVGRFYYRTSRARYLMLNWIARHVDQADRVEIWLTEDEYPELWLADTQVKVESPVRSAMSRVLDVEKIAGMKAGNGSFVAKISDPLCPWNEGVWRFETSSGKLQVTRASKPDCEMTIQGLSALITGTRNPEDLPVIAWGNPDPILQSIQCEMFPFAHPYMHENF
jgi:predicted acetyltransferase